MVPYSTSPNFREGSTVFKAGGTAALHIGTVTNINGICFCVNIAPFPHGEPLVALS